MAPPQSQSYVNMISPCSSTSTSNSTSSSSSSSSSCSMSHHHHPNNEERQRALHCRLEELKDRYTVMQTQESTIYRLQIPDDPDDESWRPLMVTWMYNMVDMFALAPSIAGTALYYLDRGHTLINNQDDYSPMHYQLLGLTALQIAIKVHETKLMPVEQLIKIGNSQFTVDDVVRMEQQLIKHLDYYLHPPTAECFVLAFGELLPQHASTSQVLRHALNIVRCGMMNPTLQTTKYSVLAYASLLVAMENGDDSHHPHHLTIQQKQTFGWNMKHLAHLTSDTPGLSQTYEALSPTKVCCHNPINNVTTTTTTKDVGPNQQQQQHQQSQPQSEEEEASATPTECEVIFEGEDGSFEVSICDMSSSADSSIRSVSKEMELRLSASFSPRQVAC